MNLQLLHTQRDEIESDPHKNYHVMTHTHHLKGKRIFTPEIPGLTDLLMFSL